MYFITAPLITEIENIRGPWNMARVFVTFFLAGQRRLPLSAAAFPSGSTSFCIFLSVVWKCRRLFRLGL